MKPHNIKYKKLFGLRNGFKVCTDLRYLGGFIGDDESKHDWYDERKNIWEQNVTNIRKTTVKYTCKIYAAVVRAIQFEWIFLQCVTKNTGDVFAGVEKLLREIFLPHLFFEESKSLTSLIGYLSTTQVKTSGLGLLNSVTSAEKILLLRKLLQTVIKPV